MSHLRSSLLTLALLLLPALHAVAQTDEFLPEIDVYYRLNPDLKPQLRLWFQAKETREGGNPVSAEIGPSLDVYMRPWLKLRDVTVFDLDDAKKRPLVFSAGYRVIPAPNKPIENRLELYLLSHFPLSHKILLTDKNRADVDWQSGEVTWEYRNRVGLERSFAIRSYHISPYASAEFFYQSKYKKWSETAIYAGFLLPIAKHVQFNTYYEHQNNTGKKPNEQLDQAGLILGLYF